MAGGGLLAALFTFAVAPGPGLALCVGDCDRNGEVTVDEIVRGTNIVLGILALSECPAFDASGDGEVTVDEILQGVGNALLGCPEAATPTSTPEGFETPTPPFTPTLPHTSTPIATATATPTITPTPAPGPHVTYFGIATAFNHVLQPDTVDAQGNPVYVRLAGNGFIIVVEARPGPNGSPVGTTVIDMAGRPHLQIQANRDLGNGSPAVCDKAGPNQPPPFGGVPGINPPSFDPLSQMISNALNDLGCRFADFTITPCTQDPISFAFVRVDATSTVQFCTDPVVSADYAFPRGDTLLTVQLRDLAGNIGEPRRIVIRVD